MVTRFVDRLDFELRDFPTSRALDSLFDHVHYVTALFAKHYFRNDPVEEFPTADLGDLIDENTPEPASMNRRGWNVTAWADRTPRTARVYWRRPPRRGHPVLVFHHGAGSIPYDRAFERIVPAAALPEWNLFCIEAPCHESLKVYFERAFDSLFHLQHLFAASILAFESAARWAVRNGAPSVVFCGVSLGGLLAMLHGRYFGSADVYIPMLAGLDIHHMFFRSANRPLADRAAIRAEMECYREALDFSRLMPWPPPRPCFPLLAEHDRLMDYERSVETWHGYPVSTIRRGHTSGLVSYRALTEHLLTHLPAR